MAEKAAPGNLIIFGGGIDDNGHLHNAVDIYNTSTGPWSVTHIPSDKEWTHSAVQGTKMFFFGRPVSSSGPAMVDVYDICGNTWSTLPLTDGRAYFGAGAADGKVLFAGGALNNLPVNTIDIFNLGPPITN